MLLHVYKIYNVIIQQTQAELYLECIIQLFMRSVCGDQEPVWVMLVSNCVISASLITSE